MFLGLELPQNRTLTIKKRYREKSVTHPIPTRGATTCRLSAHSAGIRGEEGDLTILTITRKFRAEFEKAIDDFNEAQERRTEADQIAALTSFIAQREAMVQAYKNELLSKLARGTFQSLPSKRKGP